MRAVDRWAIEEQGVPSRELMEAAGHGAGRGGRRAGAAGPGADRLRQGQQRRRRPGRRPAPARARLRGRGACVLWSRATAPGRPRRPGWPGSGAVVDAIFGTGFAGAPREPAAAAIEAINRCGAPVVACDIASGVDASSGEVAGAAVEADLTVSFHAAKLGQRIAPGKWHTGELRVVADRDPRRRARRARAAARSTPRCSALLPRRGAALDQVQLRPGDDRRRLARADRRGADVLAGGDPGRRRLRDRRRPGRPRAGLRSGPSRR